MKPSSEEQIRQTLRAWSPAVTPNPNFRAEVWARIEAAKKQPATWMAWLRTHVVSVAGMTTAAVACAIFAGAAVANFQSEQRREELLDRYIVSIDPHRQIVSSQP